MNKIVIAGEFTATSDLECVELIENGYINVDYSLTKLTIKRLINKKTYPCLNDFDILVTGEDGKDAAYGSGDPGENGKDGKTVKITVLDLAGDVHIKASGGCGGAGGKGTTGENGGRGGNGGNGGNGAIVDFYYKTKNPKSKHKAHVYSEEGGRGGRGGSGGLCTGNCGLGGESGQHGTAGARFGDGGDGGTPGQKGKITIQRIKSETAAYTYDFKDDDDRCEFIQNHGGEENLKKYPHIWNSIMKSRKAAAAANASEIDSDTSDVQIQGSILQINSIPLDSNMQLSDKNNILYNNLQVNDMRDNDIQDDDIHNFYKFSADINMSYINSTTDISNRVKSTLLSVQDEKPSASDDEPLIPDDEPSIPVAYMVVARITENNTKNIIYNDTLYGEGDVTYALNNLETDVFPYEQLAGKSFTLTANITYVDQFGKIRSATPIEKKFEFENANLESYVQQITVEDPIWKKAGKDSGNIIFLYGRTPNQQEAYKGADYWDTDGYYHKNAFANGILGTIIPISGTIQLKNFKKYEVDGASIDSYTTTSSTGHFSPFKLTYTLSESHTTLATHRPDIPLKDLGAKLQESGALTYNRENNTAHFDLKLPDSTSDKSPYDWHCNISGGFLDDSSHKCYLHGCFVLNVSHKPRIGMTNSTYDITIASTDALPSSQKKFFIGTEGSNTVYIPPIMIYWGCYARETYITIASGNENENKKRADKIQIGDKLVAMGGKTLTVANILTGIDSQILNIETGENNIRVSGGHAMWVYDDATPNGKRKTARHLKKGDKLLSPHGTFEITNIKPEPYNDTVYNFIFEEEETANYIEANGYWSGDFYAQNEEEKKEPVQISAETRAIMQEFKNFTIS